MLHFIYLKLPVSYFVLFKSVIALALYRDKTVANDEDEPSNTVLHLADMTSHVCVL